MSRSKDFDSAVAGHVARNLALLALIAKRGGNVDEGRTVDLHFTAADELSADQLAKALERFGATSVVRRRTTNSPALWNVEAEYRTTVSGLTQRQTVEKLVRIAFDHHGTFEGWGTSL